MNTLEKEDFKTEMRDMAGIMRRLDFEWLRWKHSAIHVRMLECISEKDFGYLKKREKKIKTAFFALLIKKCPFRIRSAKNGIFLEVA